MRDERFLTSPSLPPSSASIEWDCACFLPSCLPSSEALSRRPSVGRSVGRARRRTKEDTRPFIATVTKSVLRWSNRGGPKSSLRATHIFGSDSEKAKGAATTATS